MKHEMQDIVRRSEHLTEYDKDILCALYENLQCNQERLFNNIADKVREQMQCCKDMTSDWSVVTALINKSDTEQAKRSGLYEMCKISSFQEQCKVSLRSLERENVYSAGVAFLKCPYHEILAFTGRQYRAYVKCGTEEYEVSYRLEPFNAYRAKEEVLERTARQYRVEQPVLFSPLSRRAVHVKVDFWGKEVFGVDDINLDFRLDENELSDILQGGKTLVWNIEIKEQHEMPLPKENIEKEIIPLFDNTYQLYEFSTDKNEYIFVEAQASDVKRYGNSVYLGLGEQQNLDTVRYWKLVLHEYADGFWNGVKDKFCNFFATDRIYKERVRTEADINYVMGRFMNDVAEYKGISRTLGDRHAVRIYESREAYHYSKDKIFRSSAVCYVKFKKSDSWLFEDYVSYIMAYMNFFYPEFYWVGVV